MIVLKVFSLFLNLIWYRIYDGFEVDESGLEKVRELGKTHSLILIPSHKSHVDYLILSYLFYQYGPDPPSHRSRGEPVVLPARVALSTLGSFLHSENIQGREALPCRFFASI